MAKFKHALAAVAVLGLTATGALATGRSVTVMLGTGGNGIPDSSIASISLVDPGAPPQFWYGGLDSNGVLITGSYFSSQQTSLMTFSFQPSEIGTVSTTNPGIPTLAEVTSVDNPYSFVLAPASGSYIELAFQSNTPDYSGWYTGYAYVDSAGTLDYITYAPVPEPGTWALIIAGLCLAGGAARIQRRSRLNSHSI